MKEEKQLIEWKGIIGSKASEFKEVSPTPYILLCVFISFLPLLFILLFILLNSSK